MGSFIQENLAIVLSLAGLIIWAIRLEGKVLNQEKEIEAFAKIMGKLSEIAERLSFIEGNLKAHGKQ